MVFPKCLKLNEKQLIYKNFIAFNICFILIFASFDVIAMISSVLNQDGSLGNGSQAIVYATQFLTGFVWPQVLIELIGFKFTLMLSHTCHLLFFIANTFPRWETLVPGSILSGFANSTAWTTLGIYFTILSKKYSLLTGVTFAHAQTYFFGMFGFIFFFNYILGSLWVGAILQLKEITVNSTYDYASNCGRDNCPMTKLPEVSSKPTVSSVYALCGTINGACLIAIVIAFFFVDDLNNDQDISNNDRSKISIQKIVLKFKDEFKNLFELSKNLNIWLLLPVAVFLGYELTFIWYEFHRGFVSCLKNVNYIGWTSIVFGGSASIFSLLSSRFVKFIGLQTTMVLMLMMALVNQIFMISWTPNQITGGYIIFLMSVSFAFTDCLATSQVRAVFGIYFPGNTSAYSAAIIFETIGLVFGSILSIYFCTYVKLYVFIGITGISIVSFILLEISNNKKSKGHKF